MHYENRIVCFLDILGFQGLIKNNTVYENGTDNTDEIRNLKEALKDIRYFVEPGKIKTSKKITQFSDCIVFSFLISEESGVFYALLEIQWILMKLVFRKMLCRGGIAIGKVIHTEEFLFGPALIDAYHYESRCAKYPRVIVPEEVILVGKQFCARHHFPDVEEEYIKSRLVKDSDGMYYVDYFRSIQSELDEPYSDYPTYLHELSKIIDVGLQSTNAAIKIKYLWMKEKYNCVVKDIKKTLDNWDDEIEIIDAYKSLPIF